VRTVVIPLFGESPLLISEIVKQISPDRLILCHTWSKKGNANLNAQLLSSYLEKELVLDGNVQVKPLNCSEHPFSLGESFSSMLLKDNAELESTVKMEYHVLITQDTPLGYFFGLTSLSGSLINTSCYLGSTSIDISRSHPTDFQPNPNNQPIQSLPLFDDILQAKVWLQSHKGSKEIFNLALKWYSEDLSRFKVQESFQSRNLVELAASQNNEMQQSRVSNQIKNLLECKQNIRLIEHSKEGKQHYRITSIGRTVGWVMNLEDD
jgi:hypothetical protein